MLNRVQLASLGGLTDEWHMLGGNLAVHGVLGLEQEPWILRAPGYPALIALALSAGDPPRAVTMPYLMKTEVLVFGVQCLVLTAATCILFLWLSEWLSLPLALAAALVFGLNPLNLANVGLLHYALLHQLGLIAGTWALQRVMATSARTVSASGHGRPVGIGDARAAGEPAPAHLRARRVPRPRARNVAQRGTRHCPLHPRQWR